MTQMKKRAYYSICSRCGAHLDPCERCDCSEGEQDGKNPRADGTAERGNKAAGNESKADGSGNDSIGTQSSGMARTKNDSAVGFDRERGGRTA